LRNPKSSQTLAARSRINSDDKTASNTDRVEFGKGSSETNKYTEQKLSTHENCLDFLIEQSKESSSEHFDSDEEDGQMAKFENKITQMEV
jgi:hypothetical protein